MRSPEDDLIYAEGGDILVDERAWRTTAWEVGTFVAGTAYIPIPLTVPPGTYTLTLSIAGEGGRLGLSLPNGTFGGTRVVLGQVEILPLPYPPTALPGIMALSSSAGDFAGLRLLGSAGLPVTLWAGERLPFRLAWERVSGEPADTLHWALTCADGAGRAGVLPLAPSAPATWHIGHRYIAQYAPRTDPLLPAGPCTLTVQPPSGPTIPVGEVVLRQRERRFTWPQAPPTALEVSIADFARLVGVAVSRDTLVPGETFTLTLYMQANKTAAHDYTVFVHVIGEDGRLWGQSDNWPEQGAAPTTSWVKGQIIVDTHTLTLAAQAPAGTYTLFGGMYDAERGPHVPLYDANGAPFPDGRAPLRTLKIK